MRQSLYIPETDIWPAWQTAISCLLETKDHRVSNLGNNLVDSVSYLGYNVAVRSKSHE